MVFGGADHLLPDRRAARPRAAVADRQGEAAAVAVPALTLISARRGTAVLTAGRRANSVAGDRRRRSSNRTSRRKRMKAIETVCWASRCRSRRRRRRRRTSSSSRSCRTASARTRPAAPATSAARSTTSTLVNLTGGINGVKIMWEECETEYNAVARRRVLRAAEDEERRRERPSSRCRPASPTACSSASRSDKIPMTTIGYGARELRRRPRVPLGVPARHDLLGPGGGDDRVPRPEGRRRRQAQGQEDRLPVSRLGVRQGADPGARRAGRAARLRAAQDPGHAARQRRRNRSGCRSARPSPTT